MKFLSFLNELSHPEGDLSDEQVKQGVRALISSLRELKRIRPELELHSSVPIAHIPLGGGRTLASLRSDSETRDEWRFIRALDNRAFDLNSEISDLNFEHELHGRPCIGLGLANIFDSIAISFCSPEWNTHSIEILCRELQEDGEFTESQVSVHHISNTENIEQIRDWCSTISFEQAQSGQELWDNKAFLFPLLRFLDRTEDQISSLLTGTAELHAVCDKLSKLQTAAREWDTSREALPKFRSHVTPEHTRRKNFCFFNNISGDRECFDLHARFTPGAGRIHIWCNSPEGTIEIAHIGQKL